MGITGERSDKETLSYCSPVYGALEGGKYIKNFY